LFPSIPDPVVRELDLHITDSVICIDRYTDNEAIALAEDTKALNLAQEFPPKLTLYTCSRSVQSFGYSFKTFSDIAKAIAKLADTLLRVFSKETVLM